ncbi:SusC/RagA family TonB-linked outer membrane protein [Mariniflexile ostreae]|uniref:SusC/RagA family TonB-linked outer membrane protein n=2 Tax=Mariniflexile ostreae TaxID=1520892 RepID=A0ABV5FBR3_9FLAO
MKSSFRKRLFFAVSVILLSTTVYAQNSTVTGTVTDEENMPLPGATVLIQGTNKGTTTDFDGKYTLNFGGKKTLVISYLGYATKEIKIGDKSIINVQLLADASQLNEVVVIGYGEVKRKDLTGSVSSLDVGDVNRAPVASLDQAMAGRIAGVQATSSQGRPGSGSNIKIRGTGSLTQSSSPLYVIDGFPIEDFDVSSLDQADIASMEVLKGPSAVAIYGARGGNGVILITSRDGVRGKTEVSYNAFYGFNEISNRIDVLSPYEFVNLRYDVDPVQAANQYGPSNLYLNADGNSIKGIDWQEEVFRDTEVQSHNVSINGGAADTRYNLSLSSYGSDGLLQNSGFDRTYIKLKLDQKISKKLKAGANVSYTTTEVTGTHTSTNILNPDGGSSNARFNLLKDIIQGRPTGGLFYTNEELLLSPEDPDTEEGAPISNPIVNSLTQKRVDKKNYLLFNGFLSYKIVNNLELKVTGGIRQLNRKRENFDEVNSAFQRRNGYTRGEIRVSDQTNSLISSTLTYRNKFNDHSLTAMLGFDYQNRVESYVIASGSNFPEPNLGVDDLGSATEAGFPQSYKSPTDVLSSLFYRISYGFKSKYLATATLRRDGSSKFGANNKYGLFPSFGGAWRFSDESFLKDFKPLSDGKFRVEWGQVGNNRIPAFVSSAILNSTTYGENNGITAGVAPSNLANPDIKWEAQEQVNFGVDLGFFNDRITLNADWYRKTSRDLLLKAPTPASSGFQDVYRNIGEIQNEGLELALNTQNLKGGAFTWDSNINLTFPKSKTISLVESDILYSSSSWSSSNVSQDAFANDYITEVGQPFGLMYGFVDNGLYRAEDFDGDGKPFVEVSFNDEKLGYRKYVDLNGDGVINDDDKKVIGNPEPKFFGGFSNNFAYKGFDLNVFFQWSYGNDIYNANRILWTSNLKSHRNFIPEIINRWKDTNTPEQNAAATFRDINDNSEVLTSQYIEDGSYLRLKTVSLGYTFNKKWINKIGMQRFRIYVTGQDLFTWTSYTGFDPEVSTRGGGLTSGVDFGAYPRSKTFIGGLSATF